MTFNCFKKVIPEKFSAQSLFGKVDNLQESSLSYLRKLFRHWNSNSESALLFGSVYQRLSNVFEIKCFIIPV